MGTIVNATVVAINMALITGFQNIRSPSIESILACNLVAEIDALPVPLSNATIRSQGCTSFLTAPWILSAILSSGLNNPLELIVECKGVADLFDQFHAGNHLYSTPAIDHLKKFAFWAWGVHHQKVPPVAVTLDPNNEEISFYKST